MDFPVTEEQIRTLAFYLWEKDGSPDGRSDEYWLKAQQQLTGNTGEGNSGAGNGGETTSDPAQTRE
ncbi:DUF2934 domain-containing protein [Paraburkholderia sp. DHOC27]|uniref:DUF2934 domain-containing protein n=1 Tax=Paraburkholderia sp. DHOC27 TaxID=2303330 RepID=UPI000E3E3012|nr:DUF2934 domain-containing protein [Paraburkholderia sp. DHOC27]RFU48345.1 DUF2934 domain-containing protein [Paraburkholderia sp. DHOC27]